MTTPSEFIIDIENPRKAFTSSLNLVGNNRIIFSAPFGSGKTFFLKRFFNESSDFLSIHLYPVNYSVTKNEDIFELIKYDILYELLNNEVSLEKIDVSFYEAIPFLDNNEQTKILSQFFSFVPKIGKTVIDVFSKMKEIIGIIDSKREKLKKDDGTEIRKFAEGIAFTKGSIYEIDFYSNLIVDLIRRLRVEKKKQVVLVIDDLDRIDPDHIFRLLNIFASHLDLNTRDENKFGFDKVVFSCDIENIRTVFHTKFGQEVDFSGYIDKFYSREVFEFNNKAIVSQSINHVLKSIVIDIKYTNVNFISDSNKDGFLYLKYFLVSLINSNAINLRILLKFLNRDYQIPSYNFSYGRKKYGNWQLSITLVFDFLVDLFGDKKAFERAVNKTFFAKNSLENLDITEEIIARFCGQLMLLADINNNKIC
jgi:hypothetical protein